MINQRPDALPFYDIKKSTGWSYRDSFGYTTDNAGNVCSHGCQSFRTFGMFADSDSTVNWSGTQGGDYGCRDGNNIFLKARSLSCNAGDRRCALLSGDGEGIIYTVR